MFNSPWINKAVHVLAFTFSLGFFLFGCTSSKQALDGPQQTLAQYVQKSFSLRSFSDRDELINLTTDEVKEVLEGMDEASFKEYFVASQRSFVSLKIKDERKLNEDKISVTYELTYKTDKNGVKDTITNKKHAIFLRKDGHWLISKVTNLKTFIEHHNEISF